MPENDVQIKAQLKRIKQQQTAEDPALLQALPLICVGAVVIAAGVTLFVIVRKRKKAHG